MNLVNYIEEKINDHAESIIKSGTNIGEFAKGKVEFYIALRKVITKDATPKDIGLMDAINDILQLKGIVDKGTTFYK